MTSVVRTTRRNNTHCSSGTSNSRERTALTVRSEVDFAGKLAPGPAEHCFLEAKPAAALRVPGQAGAGVAVDAADGAQMIQARVGTTTTARVPDAPFDG